MHCEQFMKRFGSYNYVITFSPLLLSANAYLVMAISAAK